MTRFKQIEGFDGYLACSDGYIYSLNMHGVSGEKTIRRRLFLDIRRDKR